MTYIIQTVEHEPRYYNDSARGPEAPANIGGSGGLVTAKRYATQFATYDEAAAAMPRLYLCPLHIVRNGT